MTMCPLRDDNGFVTREGFIEGFVQYHDASTTRPTDGYPYMRMEGRYYWVRVHKDESYDIRDKPFRDMSSAVLYFRTLCEVCERDMSTLEEIKGSLYDTLSDYEKREFVKAARERIVATTFSDEYTRLSDGECLKADPRNGDFGYHEPYLIRDGDRYAVALYGSGKAPERFALLPQAKISFLRKAATYRKRNGLTLRETRRGY